MKIELKVTAGASPVRLSIKVELLYFPGVEVDVNPAEVLMVGKERRSGNETVSAVRV
jgi:hypothetical protein